jgi:hypothetical protein
MVFAFTVVDLAEFALLVEFAGRDGGLAVPGGLGHHVEEAGALDGVFEGVALIESGPGGGDGAEDVLAVFESEGGLFDVEGRVGEEADGFDVGVADEFG